VAQPAFKEIDKKTRFDPVKIGRRDAKEINLVIRTRKTKTAQERGDAKSSLATWQMGESPEKMKAKTGG